MHMLYYSLVVGCGGQEKVVVQTREIHSFFAYIYNVEILSE